MHNRADILVIFTWLSILNSPPVRREYWFHINKHDKVIIHTKTELFASKHFIVFCFNISAPKNRLNFKCKSRYHLFFSE